VEIVDDNNEPCPVGTPGRVLITALHSYAMPLLRYEIGDVAEWGAPCDCGVTLPVIKKLWGRTQHIIVNPDGGKIFARIYARDFEDIAGLQEYRFVLHEGRVVVAQIVASHAAPELAAMVATRVQRALNFPYPVIVRQVDAIDWGKSWKQETFAVSDAPAIPS
jgi:phenylacetate-CoA ligase